jgi:hypothetical protein
VKRAASALCVCVRACGRVGVRSELWLVRLLRFCVTEQRGRKVIFLISFPYSSQLSLRKSPSPGRRIAHRYSRSVAISGVLRSGRGAGLSGQFVQRTAAARGPPWVRLMKYSVLGELWTLLFRKFGKGVSERTVRLQTMLTIQKMFLAEWQGSQYLKGTHRPSWSLHCSSLCEPRCKGNGCVWFRSSWAGPGHTQEQFLCRLHGRCLLLAAVPDEVVPCSTLSHFLGLCTSPSDIFHVNPPWKFYGHHVVNIMTRRAVIWAGTWWYKC